MKMIGRILGALLAFTAPVFAGSSTINVGGGAVTLSGDTSGPSTATVTSKLNGVTPGGNCLAGQNVVSVNANGVPTCATNGGAHPGYKTSVFYQPLGPINTSGNAGVATTATMYCSAGAIGGNASVNLLSLTVRILTLGTTTFQAAVYANDHTTTGPDRPGALVGYTAAAANTATGVFPGNLTAGIGGTYTVNPGLYWWCIQEGDTTAKHQTRIGTNVDFSEFQSVGASNASIAMGTTNQMSGVSTVVASYGTFPATFVGAGATWTEVGGSAPDMRFSVQ